MAAPQIEGLVWSLRHGVSRTSAAAVLRGLAVYSYAKVAIAEAGGIPPLVELLRDGCAEAKWSAALALSVLASANDANRVLIVEADGIPRLLELLRDGSVEGKRSAARVLCHLTSNDAARVAIAEAGGIPLLVDLLRSGNTPLSAAAALRYLAHNNDANAVAIALAVGLEALVELARGGEVIVDDRPVVCHAGLPAKRKAALVVAALIRDCVPVKVRNQTWVRYLIRSVIGPYL